MGVDSEIAARVEAALGRASEPRDLAWYRADSKRLRWIIHPTEPGFAFVDEQWRALDPWPEGHHYALEHLIEQKSLLLTHSNHLVGVKDWATMGLRSATVIHLEYVDLAERVGTPGGDLASALGRLFDAHPPNLYSRT